MFIIHGIDGVGPFYTPRMWRRTLAADLRERVEYCCGFACWLVER